MRTTGGGAAGGESRHAPTVLPANDPRIGLRCRGDRYPGTDLPRRPATWGAGVAHTGAVLRRFLPKDPHVVRRVTYGIAGAFCVLSMLTSACGGQ